MAKSKVPGFTAASGSGKSAPADPRFSAFASDPRFRLPSKKSGRTKLDRRFAGLLNDEEFTKTTKVDRYGRKLGSGSKTKALQRLYEPKDEEDVHDDNDDDEDDKDNEPEDLEVETDEIVKAELQKAEKYDPARGGGFSSSDDDSDDDEENGDAVGGAELEDLEQFPDMAEEQTSVPMGEVSSRIAIVNLDWDNIRAEDLFAVFDSFVPAGGRILKLSVYQSEFGKERMEREEMEGPPKEIFQRRADSADEEDDSEDDEDDDDDDEEEEEQIKRDLLREDEGKEFDSAALRQYQLERLRYYYAVAVCSDKSTAQALYETADGTEYLNSANFMDIRFVPDEVEFDDKPRDECTSVPAGYRPNDFVTDALQHSKVKLTWDAEDTSRKETIKRAFTGSRNDINENDLKAYLGSDDSDDSDEAEQSMETEAAEAPATSTIGSKPTKKELARQKMRAALGLASEPTKSSKNGLTAPVGDMEITFTAALTPSTGEQGSSIFVNQPIIQETTAEAYVRKERERKARRKARAVAIREGRDPDAPTQNATADATAAPADLGFDDPFFGSDTEAKQKAVKTQRKADRAAKRATRDAEDTTKASQKAALELLLQDESGVPLNAAGEGIAGMAHFDMNEIVRAEKLKAKGTKAKEMGKGKGVRDRLAKEAATRMGRRGGLQEEFTMDTRDQRFAAVFDKPEFAIDPSHPRFQSTEAMRALVEEGRRKRKGLDDGRVEAKSDGAGGEKKGKTGQYDEAGAGDELKNLVQKAKKRAKLS